MSTAGGAMSTAGSGGSATDPATGALSGASRPDRPRDGATVRIPRQQMVAAVPVPAEELQRRLIAERTREALEGLRRQGVRLGHPRRCPDNVLDRVVEERDAGARLADICERLNRDGVPTPAGGSRWYPSHLSRPLRTQDAQRLRARAATRPPGGREGSTGGGEGQ